jgi:hypothetical protein
MKLYTSLASLLLALPAFAARPSAAPLDKAKQRHFIIARYSVNRGDTQEIAVFCQSTQLCTITSSQNRNVLRTAVIEPHELTPMLKPLLAWKSQTPTVAKKDAERKIRWHMSWDGKTLEGASPSSQKADPALTKAVMRLEAQLTARLSRGKL